MIKDFSHIAHSYLEPHLIRSMSIGCTVCTVFGPMPTLQHASASYSSSCSSAQVTTQTFAGIVTAATLPFFSFCLY